MSDNLTRGGVLQVGFLQRAMMENGNNQGVMYHGRKELHFASGLSMRRSFSHFTETVFYPARGRTTSPADRTLQVTLTSQATMSPPYNLTLRTRSPQKILLAKEYSGRGGNGLLELSLSGHTLSCIRFQPVPFKSNTESRYHSQR